MSLERFSKLRCSVPSESAGERLDRFLPAAALSQQGLELSRRGVRRALQSGSVYVNGKRVRVASRAVAPGDRVEIVLETDAFGALKTKTVAASPAPELTPEQILFEDSDLIVVNKTAGLPTQATQTDALGNALEQVRAYLRRRQKSEPYVVLPHRLDRGTSGALILVKAKRANAGMAQAFQHARVHKVYRLLVAAQAAEPIGADGLRIDQALEKQGRRMEPGLFGQEAVTEVNQIRRVDALEGSYALLEARPQTGRKHQIRAHCAAAGFPILGDRLYSLPPFDSMAPRPMLHAHGLSFEHPVSHEQLSIVCPEPEDFVAISDSLGLSENDSA